MEDYLQRAEEAWEHGDGPSTREMEHAFGEQILRTHISEDADSLPLEREVRELCKALLGRRKEVSEHDQERARRRLRRMGLDADEVIGTIPSYRTMARHLTDCCGFEIATGQAGTPDERRRKGAERVENLQGRLREVAEVTLEQLAAAGDIAEPGTVTTMVQVECGVCGDPHEVQQVIHGYCPEQAEARRSEVGGGY